MINKVKFLKLFFLIYLFISIFQFFRDLKEEFKNFTLLNDGTIILLMINSKETTIREI